MVYLWQYLPTDKVLYIDCRSDVWLMVVLAHEVMGMGVLVVDPTGNYAGEIRRKSRASFDSRLRGRAHGFSRLGVEPICPDTQLCSQCLVVSHLH
jgi:hypothetical protein